MRATDLGVILGVVSLLCKRWGDSPVTTSASATTHGVGADVAVRW